MSMYRGLCEEDSQPIFGHNVRGGGASINNSPININLTINITEGVRLADDEGRPTEIGRTLGFLARLFSRGDNGKLEDGRLHEGAGEVNINSQDAIARLEVMGVLK